MQRQLNGILLLNKPEGISSNAALQQAKRLYNARKAGHTGSLDPLATGMLPICFGEATKISGFLLDAAKHYRAVCRLGQTTSTGDCEGDVLSTQTVPTLSASSIEHVLNQFRGKLRQIPPMYSALKHRGQPLYKLARQGIDIERPARPITIHNLQLLSFTATELRLQVHCSKGTYIRSLVTDIGTALGCGAHLIALHRSACEPFIPATLYPLQTLEHLQTLTGTALDSVLLPTDAALRDWPSVELTAEQSQRIRHGQALAITAPTGGNLRLYERIDTKTHFFGIGTATPEGLIKPKRLLHR